MTRDIVPQPDPQMPAALTAFSSDLQGYLDFLGLPQDVFVDLDERRDVIDVMPAVIRHLSATQLQAATYISKFVAASAVGLFDAALNYLWNETIRNLRDKVARFDLEYFYDSTITDPAKRARFRDSGDLDKLDDWELIKGCQATGILTELGYKHLDYIRDLRNHTSAAHPNQNELTGLQVAPICKLASGRCSPKNQKAPLSKCADC